MKRRKPLQAKTELPRGTGLQRGVSSLRRTPMPRSGLQPGRPPVKPRKVSASSVVPQAMRAAVLQRDEHTCQLCGASVEGRAYSLQHRDPRGMGGATNPHTMTNLVTLCGTATTGCHGQVESRRTEATRCGWLVPNGATPGGWPVLRFGVRWEQPGEEWVAAVPHPRQVEAA